MFESCGYNSTLMVFLDLVECQLAKPLTFSPKVKYWQWADVQGNDGQSKVFKNTSCNNMPPSILHIESIYLLHFLHLYNGFQDYCNFYATIFWYVVLLHNSIPACSGPRTTPITSKIRYMPTHCKWFFSDVSPLMPIRPLSNEFIQQKSPVNLIHVALMKL